MRAPAALRTDVRAGHAAGDGANWFAAEPALGTTALATLRRLFRRGRASWLPLVVVAVVASAVRAVVTVRMPPSREATVVLRVSEGPQPTQEVPLGVAALRGYVNNLAFTSPNLLAIMKKHGKGAFSKVESDPPFAVQSFRERIELDVADNDFVQERAANDPPRTVRLDITFKAASPQLAWEVAQDLAELVTGSTRSREKNSLERERLAATAAVKEATAHLEREQQVAGNAPDSRPRLDAARERLMTAQRNEVATLLALAAADVQQLLRFDLVDRGRVPEAVNPVTEAALAIVSTLLIVMVVGWLVVGAFDPRVLDEEDLNVLGVAPLGRLPALPRSPSLSAAGPAAPAE